MVIRPFFSKYYAFNQRIRSNILVSLVDSRSNFSTEKFEFEERIVKIQTCGQLYRQMKEKHIFSRIPKSDLIFNVPYIDTVFKYPSLRDKAPPTVLALHGAPGSWRDFKSLISYLHGCGYRVIAPSFPDFKVYKPGIFRHSDVEKAQYIKDFLKAIFVSNVDHLVCHSGAICATLNLCLNDDQLIMKSLTLLNPVTFNLKEMRFIKLFPYIKPFVILSENPVLLKIMEVIGPFVLKHMFNSPVKVESILDPLLSATTLVYGHVYEIKEKILQVAQKLPLLYIFSENDPLIGAKCSYEQADLLGIPSSDIFLHNSEGVLIQQGKATDMLKVVAFQEGSHYVFWKHPSSTYYQRNCCPYYRRIFFLKLGSA